MRCNSRGMLGSLVARAFLPVLVFLAAHNTGTTWGAALPIRRILARRND
jgi:hypothetical protein